MLQYCLFKVSSLNSQKNEKTLMMAKSIVSERKCLTLMLIVNFSQINIRFLYYFILYLIVFIELFIFNVIIQI